MRHKVFIALALTGLCAYAQFPVSLPNIGQGRLVVCGQNTRNYFVEGLNAERPDYHDEAGLKDKTQRMVKVFRYLDADIYALCELECNDAAISYLTAALNNAAGQDVYAYVNDNQSAGNEQTKSGFIYRTDRVAPFGSNTAASSQQWYRYTMRIQGFRELASDERFVLSMNHFKAKDTTEDQGAAKRERNAQDLVNALSRVTNDPDILIMGDLNCLADESPLITIANAGYTNILLKYDSKAYSHYYYGNQLIDHIYANESMEEQINGAGVFHINTGTNKSGQYWYSDHDPYLLTVNLGDENPEQTEILNYSQDFKTGLGDFTVNTTEGTISWYINDSYGAVINGYNRQVPIESWLVSKSFDLGGYESAQLTFRHNLYYDNSNGQYEQLQTLWYSTDYSAESPTSATWHQLTIPEFGIKRWVDCTVSLPEEALTDNFRFAFKYNANESAAANYWEIDSAVLKATPVKTEFDDVLQPELPEQKAHKFIQNGKLYIQYSEMIFNSLGERII
ncbi:MAG: choice-of-anchor J domain-containing protein [Bacteroides sp.]|nr:choice-of-anchor J domain-containing protein [Bacteroides sp.]MCM1379762.1 choice-of-anchor J domain-containing protein [Bacteroides sp.]MCM1445697.1 choice-of-anchor J domain-containing protein [Prevotella sp.]